MKERPILFSASMIRALLAGTKTQTRRVVKPQPRLGRYGNGVVIGDDYHVWEPKKGDGDGAIPLTEDAMYRVLRLCPYGEIGDRLYVKETFHHGDAWYPRLEWKNCHRGDESTWVDYAADYKDDPNNPRDFAWKSPLFMPRWASRITLELTGVRVERLQEISEADAVAEGIQSKLINDPLFNPDAVEWKSPLGYCDTAKTAYQHLWNSINGPKSWDANPWVWVLEFKRVVPVGNLEKS